MQQKVQIIKAELLQICASLFTHCKHTVNVLTRIVSQKSYFEMARPEILYTLRKIKTRGLEPAKRYTKKPRQPPPPPQLDSLGLVAAVTLMIIRLLFSLSLSPLSWGGKVIIFEDFFY